MVMHRETGSTLIECAFAGTILVAVAAVLPSRTGADPSRIAFEQLAARTAAENRLEHWRGHRTQLAAKDESAPLDAAASHLAQVRVHELVHEVEPGLFEVQVQVSWIPNGERRRHETELSAWITR